ncbi:hypothetical protein TRFO_37200 [Tritrichomonas foetus]|uniref:Protein kinase domain-containing protein n=1 Tax=Tritrichomonas foetus TaxID=1144522 RepID=A0A1J4JBU4_9EUKA|nr:hypothetical protein TRFO_37200 [Tritrichomonas foetus]|eukprot:OHS96616.1 hypothetical protein TRFO_37200 [Tritrichomonas foetus]
MTIYIVKKFPYFPMFDLSNYKVSRRIFCDTYFDISVIKQCETKEKFVAYVSLTSSDYFDRNATEIHKYYDKLLNIDHPCILRHVGRSDVDLSDRNFPTYISEYYGSGKTLDFVIEESNRPKNDDNERSEYSESSESDDDKSETDNDKNNTKSENDDEENNRKSENEEEEEEGKDEKSEDYESSEYSYSYYSEEEPPQYDNTARQIILTGIASGMKYFHSLGFIHRDLKPSKIFIDDDFYPKISGFEVCEVTSSYLSGEPMGNVVGSPLFIAPEVMKDVKYSEKSDVFSFAMIMYQVLTGCMEFYPDTPNTFRIVTEMVDGLRPNLDIQIKESFKNLIKRCWDTDPNNRPSFEEIFDLLSKDPQYLLDDVNQDAFKSFMEYLSQ